MASRKTEHVQPGDLLQVIHGFQARSADELSLQRGDKIELIEKDDDFGDGWYLGKHLGNGQTGLFPQVYTQPAPRATLAGHLPGPKSPPPPPTTTTDTNGQLPNIVGVTDQAKAGASQPNLTTPTSIHSDETLTPGASTDAESIVQPAPLQPGATTNNRPSSALAAHQRVPSLPLPGEVGSPVMTETLSVIDEHITGMNTPRHSGAAHDRRNNDSGSEYSNQRLSYINGEETDEEESAMHSEAEVMSWTSRQVAEYLEDVGVEKKHVDIFKEQDINGEVLLGMDQATIFMKEFELGPVGPRLRTWLKIKALQQEVKTAGTRQPTGGSSYAGDDSASDVSRNRSTSMSTVLPRIPSMSQSAGARTPTRQASSRHSITSNAQVSTRPISHVQSPSYNATSHPASFYEGTTRTNTMTDMQPPSGFGHAHRPSAHSIRSMNHSRRHSAIDPSNEPMPAFDGANDADTTAGAHKKQPSFDRNWTMGGGPRSGDSIRPASSAHHGHSMSSQAPAMTPEEHSLTVVPSIDFDRGYFSGPESEQSRRNVLRKRESSARAAHTRKTSHSSDHSKRTAAVKRQSRVGSLDSLSPASALGSTAWAFGGSSTSIAAKRSPTVPIYEPSKQMMPTKDLYSPTITKLDHNDTHSIDAIANSPHVPDSAGSSTGRASPSPGATASQSFFKKSRIAGLRAISDAVTGNEKAAHGTMANGQPSPLKESKDSPLQSPTRTGSTTPSATTKSFEMDESEKSKRSTSSSTGQVPSFPPRRKTKHTTSAYTRGLQQKGPLQQIDGCDYSGWMKKKSSNLMTSWKPRLFVLRGRRLSYYYSEFDTEEKGLIDISSHRVLPANEEKLTGLHASVTRATSTPSSPNNPTITTTAASDAAKSVDKEDNSGVFIFKLVPPRSGVSRGVNFTKPTVHYFAVDNIVQGRLWMAALMKATIDRDPDAEVLSTYKDKTISLAKAMQRRERPPALKGDDEMITESPVDIEQPVNGKGLNISGLESEKADTEGTDSVPKISLERPPYNEKTIEFVDDGTPNPDDLPKAAN